MKLRMSVICHDIITLKTTTKSASSIFFNEYNSSLFNSSLFTITRHFSLVNINACRQRANRNRNKKIVNIVHNCGLRLVAARPPC